jgi:uncharacterized DUF497 family protein
MFEWDENKSKNNKKKHGFLFDEILGVFDDPTLLAGTTKNIWMSQKTGTIVLVVLRDSWLFL